MTVSALNVLSCIRSFWPSDIETSVGTCFSLKVRWKKLSQSLVNGKKKLRVVITVSNLSICLGLTVEVIHEMCSTLRGLHTLDGVMEKLPVWRKEYNEKILHIINDVVSKDACRS